MDIFSDVKGWLYDIFQPSQPALRGMRLSPEESTRNPLMACFVKTLSWWKHLEDELPRLAEMGFTQVWLPPPNKAMVPEGRGYDAYDLWDLGEFHQKGTVTTRWGTKEELLQASEVARKFGINILIDAVLNHKLGADRRETFPAVPVDPNDRLKDIGEAREIDAWTAFDFPARKGQYSDLRWNQQHFTGVDWDDRTKSKCIFRIVGEGHKGWSRRVSKELGNYDYLLGVDIDHRHPDVRKDLAAWGEWVLETTGAAGFRLDAIKHIDREFLLEFITTTKTRSNKHDMFVVAECWSENLRTILPYVRAFRGEAAFFDVPLHHNFYLASQHGPRYDLRTVLNNTLAKVRPHDAVTFVDNHDTAPGQTLESWVNSNFKIQAYALILLHGEGYPCVFYGDLYLNSHCYNETVSRNLKLLIEARKLFAYGPTKDYFQDRNCIGFVRMGNSNHETGCAVVISNALMTRSAGAELHRVRMNVGRANGGATYRNFLEPEGRVDIAPDGWGVFPCRPNCVQVWVKSMMDVRLTATK